MYGVGLQEGELQVRGHEEVRLELSLVPDHALTGRQAEEHESDRADLAATEALSRPGTRIGDGLLARLETGEERGLLQADADVQREEQQEERDQERVAPAGAREVGRAHVGAEREDDGQREEEAEGRRGLDP